MLTAAQGRAIIKMSYIPKYGKPSPEIHEYLEAQHQEAKGTPICKEGLTVRADLDQFLCLGKECGFAAHRAAVLYQFGAHRN